MAGNTSPYTEEIRRVVREEIRRSHGNVSGNIYSRTQDSLRSAAIDMQNQQHLQRVAYNSSSVQDRTSTNRPKTMATVEQIWGQSQKPKRNTVPGHSYRYSGRTQKTLTAVDKSKTFNVILLDADLEMQDKYTIGEENELINGYVDLKVSFKEKNICQALVKVFRAKYSPITAADFEFVKRERKNISIPVVSEVFEWTFEAIKALTGEGKLYCRLNVEVKSLIEGKHNGSIDIFDICETEKSVFDLNNRPPTSSCTSQSSSISVKINLDKVNQLKEMFPGRPSKDIENVLELHDNVGNAALAIASSNSKCESLVEVKSQRHFSTLSHCLEELSIQFIKEKEKLKIDFDDILNDAFAYYKDPCFDPKKPLKL